MRFIDKTINEAAGNQLVDDFLDDQWDSASNLYNEIDYRSNAFRQNLKLDLRDLVLTEQANLCCYCMRDLSEIEVTLEHIVPRSTNNQADLDQYTHIPIIRDNVVLQSTFEVATTKQATPPFPHQIAYQNLTASCDGKIIDGIPRDTTSKFCNLKRENKIIEPLFYLNDIETGIEYRRGGLLSPSDLSHLPTINNVNLNYETLQKIRQIWYYISVEEWSNIEAAVSEHQRSEILTLQLTALRDTSRKEQLIANFKTEKFWKILLQFRWFYGYYRNRYPVDDR